MPIFEIGHLSDLHFSELPFRQNKVEALVEERAWKHSKVALTELMRGRAFYPSTFNPDVAVEVARTIRANEPYLDALIVSGDLATTGEEPDLAVARRYFSGAVPLSWSPFAAVPALYEDDGRPVVTLPGNHDRYEGAALFPQSEAFERHFHPGWDLGASATYSVDGSDRRVKILRLERDGATLAFVLADLTLTSARAGEGLLGWVGQGRVRPDVLHSMVRSTRILTLEAERRSGVLAVVWVVHYPPEFEDLRDSLRLIGEESLVEAASNNGVRLILAGHTHEARSYICKSSLRDGIQPVRVICCGATTGVSLNSIYEFSVLYFSVGSGGLDQVDVRPYRWNPRTFAFDTLAQEVHAL